MKAVVWVWVEVVRLCRLMAAADGLIHSVAVAKMKTALEVSTIVLTGWQVVEGAVGFMMCVEVLLVGGVVLLL